ncbi:hypothetical protein [Candidatus Berkiella aquae]|uniref:Uncharacterized protein n=1 Tax=Candidatus Berkiella aquae TaxID=295108 RepID=A0A0Q9YXT1_9GAMM|nr:hypothetical protein [Candidatus Berkiella aquae]MCS5710098.1 hypothetical protein [Candidatus Berkiella aquae]
MGLFSHVNRGIDLNLLCKTTGWHNNCGLNCLTHFLYEKLHSGELQRHFSKNPEYIALLETFQSYYQLSERPTWNEVYQILATYSNATDREAILSPVLRQHLGKILPQHSEMVWNTDAAGAISEYLTTGEVNDIAAPLIQANRVFVDSLKATFENRLQNLATTLATEEEKATAAVRLANAKPPRAINDESVQEYVEFQRRNALEDQLREEAKDYWLHEGMQRYADYIATLDNSVMVSADQLGLLGQSLNIGIEIYTPSSISAAENNPHIAAATHGAQNLPEGDFRWQLKVYNAGVHWEYEEPSHSLTQKNQHNQSYPDEFSSDSELGIFKTYGGTEDNQEELVPAYVRSQWELLKSTSNVPIQSAGETPSQLRSDMASQINLTLPTQPHPTTSSADYFHHRTNLNTLNATESPSENTQSSRFKPLTMLRRFINHTRSARFERRYQQLQHQANLGMEQLLHKLQNAIHKGTINDTEKQVIFEFYYNLLEDEFKKGATKSLNQRRVESAIKEIKRKDVFSLSRNVLEIGHSTYDQRHARKRTPEESHDPDPRPTKKRRLF